MSDQEDRSGASCSAIAGPVGVSAGGSTANEVMYQLKL